MWKIETERADLFDINMIITMEVKTIGSYTKEKINEAFNKVVKSFEILNTKIIIDKDGNAFYKENDLHNNTVTFTKNNLEELINEQEKIRFKLEDGEYLRLFVNQNTFTFMLHHLGGDGKSLLYFIENFFKAINNEEVEYKKIKLLTKDTMPKNSSLPLIIKLYANNFNKKWKKEKQIFTFEDLDKSFNLFWKNHKTKIEIETPKIDEILKECKKNNIGYTSYDIAQRLKETNTIQDVGLAVDARLDKNRTMSNQATGISIKYKYDKNKSLIDNAKIINKLIRKKLNNIKFKYFILNFMSLFDPTLIDAVNLNYTGYFKSKTSSILASILGYGNKTKDLSITNLTKADIKTEYGEYKIEEITFVPPVVSYGKNIVGLITTNDKLISTRHYYS